MFYSNTIFASGTSLTAHQTTALIGTVNLLSAFIGMALLIKIGRRTLMLWTNALISIDLVLLGYLHLHQHHETMVIVLVVSFIILFELGPGPITWLYMAEIMQDKGISIACVVNWLATLVISATIPSIIEAIG